MLDLLPRLVLTLDIVPFAVVAVAMVAITIFVLGAVLPRDGRAPLVTQMLLALAVLGGGTVLLVALLFVFLDPNGTTAWTWVLLAFNFMMMTPAGLWFVAVVLFRDERISAPRLAWPLAVGVVTTGSEAIMGVMFATAEVGHALPVLTALGVGLSSAWFFWSMAAVMGALLLWAPLTRVERAGALALTVAALIGPWVTADPLVGGLTMLGLMSLVFGGLTRLLLRGQVGTSELGFLIGLDIAFLAMALTGLGVVLAAGADVSAIVFGSTMGVAMVFEVTYLVRRTYRGPTVRPWVARAPDPDERAAPAPGPPAAVGAAEHPLASR